MSQIRWISTLLLACAFGLAACGSTAPSATPTLVSTLAPELQGTSLAGQFNLLATQTQVAALTLTASAAQTTPLPVSPPPLVGESPLPTAALMERVGPFRQVSREEAMIAGRVIGLQATGDGSLLLLSESGYSQFKDGRWTGYFTDYMGVLAGIDRPGRVWTASRDGAQISAWDGTEWITYSADQGWTPVAGIVGSPLTGPLVEDSRGGLWLATGEDLRHFDGSAWQVYSLQALGMQAPDSEGLTNSFVLAPIGDEIWAGRCDWDAYGPVSGGARRFDGNSWQDTGLPPDAGCTTAILQAPSGELWVGSSTGLYHSAAISQTWELLELPEPPPQTRIGYFNNLSASPSGDLWAALALCSEASCYGGEALYRLEGGNWLPVGSPSQSSGSRVLFDKAGNAWVLAGSGISQIIDDQPRPPADLLVLSAAIDASGDLWLVAQAAGPPTLWILDSE